MEIRILGRDLEVSEIGFGCMGMSHAYEVKSIDEMLAHMPMSQVFGGSKIQKK